MRVYPLADYSDNAAAAAHMMQQEEAAAAAGAVTTEGAAASGGLPTGTGVGHSLEMYEEAADATGHDQNGSDSDSEGDFDDFSDMSDTDESEGSTMAVGFGGAGEARPGHDGGSVPTSMLEAAMEGMQR